MESLKLTEETGMIGLRLGIFMFALLITLIGGRVVPGFTAGALRAEGGGEDIGTTAVVEKLALAGVLAAIAADFALSGTVAGVLSLAAALMLALRMRRWGTIKIMREPIVWVLHLGHGWLVIGFALNGLAHLTPFVTFGAAIHALTAGAMGTMIIGIMTRAALGHSGRPIKAATPIAAAYVLVSLGALMRISAPWIDALLGGGAYGAVIGFGAFLWAGAFAVFTLVYWPILSGPKVDGRG